MNVIKALILLGLVACVKPVGFQESGIETPDTWQAFLVVDDCAEVEQCWWHNFDDEVLDALIGRALASNLTLAIAATRIEEARAARLGAFSKLMPDITLNADAQRGNQGFYTADKILAYEDINFQAAWELDLFGKNQDHLAATMAIVQNEFILRQGVIVTLLADVARAYFDMRNFQTQLVIAEKNLETQKQTLELTQAQFQEAYASDFDVQRAAAQVSTTEAAIPTFQISLEVAKRQLDVLLGSTPGENEDLYSLDSPLKPLDPLIVFTAPATVLGTRPDVRASERAFAASISTFSAAKKEWFPTISLAAFFGFQWLQGFNNANAASPLKPFIHTWNVAGTLVQPLINFGRIEADIEAAGARECRAYLEYQQTVLEALQDMENALTQYFYETFKNVSLANAALHNLKALELSRQQYTNGYTNLLDVLIVQRNALLAESEEAESSYKLRKDLVNIYTAAGGGWACPCLD